MADGGEETALLGQRSGVRHYAEGVHLKAVVVVEAEGLVLDDARVKLEAAGLQALARARVAAIENRHIILLRHLVDCVEKRQEVLLRVDILLAMGAQKNVLPFLQPQPSMNIRSFNLRQVVMQHFRHRGAGHVRALLRQTSISQVPACVLGISHVHIRDDIHDAAVGLLRQALVFAAVAGFHVEDRDMEPLSPNDAQTRIRIPQHQYSIRLHLHHQLIALRDDVAHGLAQVGAHGLHIDIRIRQLEVFEKDAVKVVVVVLPGVRQ